MKRINPHLSQIKITEYRHWNDPKVKSLIGLMESGDTELFRKPIYITWHRNEGRLYLIYDGNTRFFLMKSNAFPIVQMYLMETDRDLEEVRSKTKEIYWPGRTLEEVIGYLACRADFYIPKLMEGLQEEGMMQ